MPANFPSRIVCLTPETTEVLYALGEQARIAGISGFTVHPPRARREKPRVAAYTTARLDAVLALEPDLVLAFSDLQAGLAGTLVRAGVAVHVFNQRSVSGILQMVLMVGALVGAGERAQALVAELDAALEAARRQAERLPFRPRVYFEEWNDPLICGIGWVSELIAIAGGEDCFADRATRQDAAGRIIADPAEVVHRGPEVIVGSWCGRRFRPERVRERPGWAALPAVRNDRLHEIKSADILQPGPAVIRRGLPALQAIIAACAGSGAGQTPRAAR